MPAVNVGELRARLDAFARSRLTPADFDPVLDLDGELWLGEITPELFRTLHLLEPYGVGNQEPVFAARGVQLTAPPRILKDKHVKLKLKPGPSTVRVGAGDPSTSLRAGPPAQRAEGGDQELSAEAVLMTPRCHPDGAAIRQAEKAAAVAEAQGALPRTENRELRTKITFDALGWNMAERLAQTPLLAGDSVDIAFTIGHNDHPEYGGIELALRDFKAVSTRDGNARPAEPSPR